MSEKTDWDAIERDFRAGLLSVREIAIAHEISHTAINKRSKAHGWVRDLTAKIQAKAEALVSKQAVSAEVSKQDLATEREIVDANAARIAQVRSEHRKDIGRARALALRLLTELESPLEELALPARVSTLKALSETLKNLVGLEREAYGIDAVALPSTGSDVAVDQMDGARRIAFVLARATHQLNAQVH